MAGVSIKLDFKGMEQASKDLDELGGDLLRKAVGEALTKSKAYANKSILQAMESSPYDFMTYGDAYISVQKTEQLPVEWDGDICTAYVGADLKEAPEQLILALGVPSHVTKTGKEKKYIREDRNLKNAIKGKGKYKKGISRIQEETFNSVLAGVMGGGKK